MIAAKIANAAGVKMLCKRVQRSTKYKRPVTNGKAGESVYREGTDQNMVRQILVNTINMI